MIENYQEEQRIREREPADANFATVGSINAGGIGLIFDGEEAESTKHYKCNSFVKFTVGDRVRIIKDSGTYVVEYPVGNPKTSFAADTATSATDATNATNADRADFLKNVANSLASYNLYFDSNADGTVFRIRKGSSGTWRQIYP